MIVVNGFKMSAASEQQFESSLQIRKCSYSPRDQLEITKNSDGTPVIHMPLNCKRLWFQTYCEENRKAGRIEITSCFLDIVTEIPGDLVNGKIQSEAKAYIDDNLISNGIAAKVVNVRDLKEVNDCLDSITGRATSKALSAGGFGTVEYFEIEPEPSLPSGTESNDDIPFHMPEVPAAEPADPSASSSALSADMGASSSPSETVCETASLFEQLGGTADPVTAAKSVKYPAPGRNNGKLLGTMSSRQLSYFITNFGDRKEPEYVKAVEAAKLIYEDYQKKSGAAITSGK